MKKFYKVLALSLALLMCLSMAACKKKAVSYKKVAKDDPSSYTIVICTDGTSDYYNDINTGFSDAITELFGSDRITYKEFLIDEDFSLDDAESFIKNADPDIIFAIGEKSLKAAKYTTSDVPIVACDIMDYQSLLDIKVNEDGQVMSAEEIASAKEKEKQSANNDADDSSDSSVEDIVEWDGKTGSNITGISSLPDMDSMLSLIIESTSELKQVALLYSADDKDSIVQIKELTQYMDQAKIPYKEYEVASGANQSQIRSQVASACSECNAIYIPSASKLTENISTIASTATAAKVTTIGGDATLGKSTLTSLFYDSYYQGYQSAKLVYRILRNSEKPGEIKIQGISEDTKQKLYNKTVAASFDMEFPKSFEEINSFLKEYKPGDNVSKLDLSSDEDQD